MHSIDSASQSIAVAVAPVSDGELLIGGPPHKVDSGYDGTASRRYSFEDQGVLLVCHVTITCRI